MIVAAIVTSFFQVVHNSEPNMNHAIVILSTGLGLAAVIIALGIFVKLSAKKD